MAVVYIYMYIKKNMYVYVHADCVRSASFSADVDLMRDAALLTLIFLPANRFHTLCGCFAHWISLCVLQK